MTTNQNPTAVSMTVGASSTSVTWTMGANYTTGEGVTVYLMESASQFGTYSYAAEATGRVVEDLSATITYAAQSNYWYKVVVNNPEAGGDAETGPTASSVAQYTGAATNVLPTFTLTSISATEFRVAWSGGSRVAGMELKTYIADFTDMSGNTLFYNPGLGSAGNSGTQTITTAFTPGYSFSIAPVVTFQNSLTQTATIVTPGLQVFSPTVVYKNTGGTVTTNGLNTVITYTTSGTFNLIYPNSVPFAFVAFSGGGGGGANEGGGGGAGEGIYFSNNFTTGDAGVSFTVGQGGAPGANGGDTTFGPTTLKGGGCGGSLGSPNGANGGCGGGGGGDGGVGGTGEEPDTNGGNSFTQGTRYQTGGGGGYAIHGNGGNGVTNAGGAGGAAYTFDLRGIPYLLGGGGGGQTARNGIAAGGAGGSGIGGTGAVTTTNGTSVNATTPTANTGSGGGGGTVSNGAASAGAAGIVVFVFPTSGVDSLNPDLRPFQPRSKVGRSDYYKHPGRGMPRYMTEWMDSLNV